jgi:hypothetical protein
VVRRTGILRHPFRSPDNPTADGIGIGSLALAGAEYATNRAIDAVVRRLKFLRYLRLGIPQSEVQVNDTRPTSCPFALLRVRRLLRERCEKYSLDFDLAVGPRLGRSLVRSGSAYLEPARERIDTSLAKLFEVVRHLSD